MHGVGSRDRQVIVLHSDLEGNLDYWTATGMITVPRIEPLTGT